jgi:hypothetical protein
MIKSLFTKKDGPAPPVKKAAAPSAVAARADTKTVDKEPSPVLPVLALELKVALVGGRAVGKSSPIRRYTHNVFNDGYAPTVGFDIISYAPQQARLVCKGCVHASVDSFCCDVVDVTCACADVVWCSSRDGCYC